MRPKNERAGPTSRWVSSASKSDTNVVSRSRALFIASRSAKAAPLELGSMILQEFIDRASRLAGIEALDHLRIGVSRTLSFTAQDPECFHVDADCLCCHACIMHARCSTSITRAEIQQAMGTNLAVHSWRIVRRSEGPRHATTPILDFHNHLLKRWYPMKAKALAPVRSQPRQPFNLRA
jgi:hypothetical protein